MAECRVEKFTLKELSAALTKGYIGKTKIVVPMFQRGKRWDKNADKENKFIDSLKKNYPVGTLLFYKSIENGVEVYTLIDGLQRSTTIKKYLTNPTKYFSMNLIDADARKSLYNLLCNDELVRKSIDDVIVAYVTSLQNYDEFDMIALIGQIHKDLNIKTDFIEINNILKKSFDNITNEYMALCNVEIPALIYTGPEDTLPEIFDRVNSEGVPLSEYEIFVASWPKDLLSVENNDIIQENVDKYNFLSSGEYELQGYDEAKFKKDKLLTSFDYVFGFSKYICKKYESLRFNLNLSPDIANPVGFELLNACFYNSKKTLRDVYKIILSHKENLGVLESCIDNCINFVENCISPITCFKSNCQGNNGKIFHSQLQILSMISCTFRLRYNSDLKELANWYENKKILEKNLIKYYVYDIITKYWYEGGGKIFTANSEMRYLKSLNFKVFSNAIDTYSDNAMLRREKTQIKGVSEADYVILNAIYMDTFSAKDQLSIQKFDVEHIAPKEQMKKYVKNTNSDGLPISHIANLCYLPEEVNRSKKEKNFYQDSQYLKKTDLKISEIEEKYSFTKKNDLIWMDTSYGLGDERKLFDSYMNFLNDRYDTIKRRFLKSLGFDDVSTLEKNKNKNYINGYNDNDFNERKVGEIAKDGFRYLASLDLLTDDDIIKLQNEEYSQDVLDCNYPVLVDSIDKVIDKNGKRRYYKDIYRYRNNNYYLSSEWYEEDREKLVSWLKSKFEKDENDDFIQFI